MSADIVNLASVAAGMTSNAYFVPGATPTVVDAGAGFDIVEGIDRLEDRPEPEHVVITHTHPDHVGNVDALRSAYGIETLGFNTDHGAVDTALADGDQVEIGDHSYTAWHTPGHAPDHLCLYAPEPRILFSGDLIFPNGGVGRTDLPGCDHDALVDSINRVADTVDDSLEELYPGHGQPVADQAYRHVDAARRFVES